MPQRKLLNTKQVCIKTNCSLATWNRSRREELEERGFPKPIIDGGKGVGKLWDERAIDLWMDAQMDPNLLALGNRETHQRAAAAYDYTDKLAGRARTLSL